MQFNRFARHLTSLLLTALLLSLYFWAFFTRPQPLSVWLAVVGLVLVIWLSAITRSEIGIIAGLIVGFASSWRLFFPDIVFWPPAIATLRAWLHVPALLFWLLHPVIALAVAQSIGLLLRKQQKLTGQNSLLAENNQRLEQQVRQHQETLRSLSEKRLYRQALWQQLSPNTDQEPIVGALITMTLEKIRTGQRNRLLNPGQESAQTDDQPFFNLLLHIQPDLVAILDLKGSIIIVNPCLMAIYGYPPDTQVAGRRFSDFLLPADMPRAVENMKSAIHNELDPTQTYAMRSAAGSFRELIVDPFVSFECTGDPLVIIVSTRRPAKDDVSRIRPPVATLIHGPVWCLSADGITLYVNRQVAAALGESVQMMLGKRADRYISRKQLSHFHSFLTGDRSMQPNTMDLVMQPHGEHHATFRLKSWPAISETGLLVGLTFIVEDISDRKAIEDTLQHRLKMEQMISEISKRFVAVRAEEMDSAVNDVLKMIGDSENTVESSLEIFRSKAIKHPVRYHVRHKQTAADKTASKSQELFEAVSVPIMIEEERLGYFHFSLPKYQSSWLENDLPLIRLIGEILINALIRREHELNIRINEKRLSTTLQSIGDAVIATDTASLIISMNRAAEKLTGWTYKEANQKLLSVVMHTNRSLQDLMPAPADTESTDSAAHSYDIRLWSRDGNDYYIAATCSPIEDQSGSVYGDVIVFRDITREKQENDEIRYISYHDALTGLYNRAFFEEELRRLNTERQYPITLILGDCNGLKIANDIFGHIEGDRLLIAIADILRKSTRKEDIVARWGGDEFAIILPKTDEAAATAVRERILDLCNEAPADPIRPSLALGSATNTNGSNDLEALLKLAEDRMYRHKLMEGKSARNAILQSIKRMLYEKSYETEAHAGRMIDIARKFGRIIGLTIDELEELSLLAVLHDMGKIGIPDQILRKTDKLNSEEWELMKKHPEKGYNIAKSTPELTGIAQLILHHHEHWDGSGYPDGLKGEKIPKLSRVLSIIDAYDVITHHRSYKKAQSEQDALDEISRCAGTQFDPNLVPLFVSVMKADAAVGQADGTASEDGVESAKMAKVDLVDLVIRQPKAPVSGHRSRNVDPGSIAESD